MKFINTLSLAGLSFLCTLSSCSDSSSINTEPDDDSTEANYTDDNIVSRQAYDRGVAAGRYAASLTPESPEREKALIEIHGMVSSLRRNGYKNSAHAFQKGVDYALKATERK